MNLKSLRELESESTSIMKLLAQDRTEWFCFLEFIEGYFKNRGIINPVIVEIGIMKNAQRVFYRELLSADHVGIDINENSAPDILGDSQDIQTTKELRVQLGGRKIDLLFIDGNHSYENVKQDYELFEPLTKHIIAFHDISASVNSEVNRFWEEVSRDGEYLSIAINKHNKTVSLEENKFKDMGIGLIIKGE